MDRKNIKELFADYKGEYKKVEIDWGEPVGKEIWQSKVSLTRRFIKRSCR